MTQQPQILIVQSQPAAEAATAILGLPAHAAVGLDWSTIAGRRVILWPTNTPLSLAAFRANASTCWSHGAEQVKLITPGPLDPPGWDAAAALADRWEREEMLDWMRGRASEVPRPEPVADAPDDDGPEDEVEPYDDTVWTPPEPPMAVAPAGVWDQHADMETKWANLGLEVVKGHPICNVDAVLRILSHHPQLGDVLWFDEFLQRIMRKDQKTKQPREWADADEVDLLAFLQRDLGLTRLKLADVRSAIISVAFRTRKNCAKDWLTCLKWDGKPRADEFFSDTFGCDSTVYSRAVSKNFWISMAARVMDPGCKVDNMVILEGSQGAGKSSSLEVIGGDWFAVQHESISGKGFFEILQGKMLIEISEMDAFSKAEVTKVKGVVTTRTDRYRDAYGRHARDHDRTSVFVGTTNKDDWNRDETGARRFWPIRCLHAADIALIRTNREQLFAEAVHRWRAKESWWEMPLLETTAEQEDRRQEDSWFDLVVEWIVDNMRQRVTLHEVMEGALNMRRAEMHRVQEMRVAAILRQIKWIKRNSGGRRYWEKPEATT